MVSELEPSVSIFDRPLIRTFPIICLGVASFWYHGFTPYTSTSTRQIIGLLLIVSTWISLGVLYARLPKEVPLQKKSEATGYWIWSILLLLISLFFFFDRLTIPGLWSEEVYWLEFARSIAEGSLIDPMGVKGDHPANFQAWPCGVLFWLTGSPFISTRLPGILYSIGTAFFLERTSSLIYGPTKLPLALPFALFSACLLYYSHSGWNEINIVPFLVSAQLFYLVQSKLLGSERRVLLLAAAAALGFWTLYTPFLVSLIVSALFIVFNFRSRRSQLLYVVVFAALCAPTIGKVSRDPKMYFGRHFSFLNGGEHGVAFGPTMDRTSTYKKNVVTVGRNVSPTSLVPLPRADRSEIKLEWPAFMAGIVGCILVVVVGPPKARLLLLVPGIGIFIGLMASNQSASPWRELVLLPTVLLLAAGGFHYLIVACRRVGHGFAVTMYIAVIIFQFLFFTVEWPLRRIWGEFDKQSRLASIVSKEYAATPTDYQFLVVNTPSGLFGRYARALIGREARFHLVSRSSEIRPLKVGTRELIVACGDDSTVKESIKSNKITIVGERTIADDLTHSDVRIYDVTG